MYANLHTMMLGHETLMRTMSYGRLLERKGFRRSYMANASDAFSVGWGYASMLASGGIKYFIKSTCYNGSVGYPGHRGWHGSAGAAVPLGWSGRQKSALLLRWQLL